MIEQHCPYCHGLGWMCETTRSWHGLTKRLAVSAGPEGHANVRLTWAT